MLDSGALMRDKTSTIPRRHGAVSTGEARGALGLLKLSPSGSPIVSYALRSLLGLLLLAGAGALIAQYLNGAFNQLPWQMLQLVLRRP